MLSMHSVRRWRISRGWSSSSSRVVDDGPASFAFDWLATDPCRVMRTRRTATSPRPCCAAWESVPSQFSTPNMQLSKRGPGPADPRDVPTILDQSTGTDWYPVSGYVKCVRAALNVIDDCPRLQITSRGLFHIISRLRRRGRCCDQ